MDIQNALIAFDALSQETRLKTFRLLVEYGPEGAPAGTLSSALGIPHNTLSFHLNHMSNANLILSERQGRSILYRANFDFFTKLLHFMIEDCCKGNMARIHNDKERGCAVIELDNCCTLKKGKTT